MERVSDIRCTVGESPTWSAAELAWYWVDIPAKRVWRLDGASGAARFWTTTEMVACVAAKAGGGLIAGMETGIFSLELGEAEAAVQIKLATPAAGLGEGMRFNDGRCDRQGRFWSGTMFMDMSAARAVGELYRYDAARGISAPVVSELITQNGLAFSPDGRTMYLSDSHPARRMVWAFDYDIDDGVPSGRRVFADMSTYVGRPDGAAIDSDGCYWICGNDGGCVLRFTPDGKLDRRIDVPMLKPAMCAFGGKDLDTLMVTSIVSGKPEDAEWGGAVLLLRPGVQGVAETPFGL
ncbi:MULTISPECIES: SMP-30/gluconolactonase/LRE family protein [unclassified Duganella]|uniref:SMP-30/gluconolactonase/LRE family protein n=1 Tax=unclassified Duganella TaxID=2636909 RepID=UPI000E346514|nr:MULTISPECIES: SMP-30/gluconolactonase/LRE family protein [unclassified Duganella]RFP10796.1 SMP-30/gluconolactonase/LRE family protein [Duganella sp. BJB475]RFP27176.1 SMP-30/gluconolactonase/LRE family protein [Duganella sp. BJB476]